MRMTRVFGTSLAVLVLTGALAPLSANASPFGRMLHLHPGAEKAKDSRITVVIRNEGRLFQDVKVDGHVYTVLPHDSLAIKAPAGTAVYADSTTFGHRKGDLLFAVTPQLQGSTVTLN